MAMGRGRAGGDAEPVPNQQNIEPWGHSADAYTTPACKCGGGSRDRAYWWTNFMETVIFNAPNAANTYSKKGLHICCTFYILCSKGHCLTQGIRSAGSCILSIKLETMTVNVQIAGRLRSCPHGANAGSMHGRAADIKNQAAEMGSVLRTAFASFEDSCNCLYQWRTGQTRRAQAARLVLLLAYMPYASLSIYLRKKNVAKRSSRPSALLLL